MDKAIQNWFDICLSSKRLGTGAVQSRAIYNVRTEEVLYNTKAEVFVDQQNWLNLVRFLAAFGWYYCSYNSLLPQVNVYEIEKRTHLCLLLVKCVPYVYKVCWHWWRRMALCGHTELCRVIQFITGKRNDRIIHFTVVNFSLRTILRKPQSGMKNYLIHFGSI